MNVLDPQLNNEPFTSEEDQIILKETSSIINIENGETNVDLSIQQSQQNDHDNDNINSMGVNWSSIAQLLPGRTDNQIWRRWKELNGI